MSFTRSSLYADKNPANIHFPVTAVQADTFSALLGIKGNPNNGTEGVLYSVLKNPPEYPAVPVEQLKDCPNADQASEVCF